MPYTTTLLSIIILLQGMAYAEEEDQMYEPDFKEWCEEAPVDVIIVMDSSGSVEKTFSKYKDTARRLVRLMPVGEKGTRVSLLQYSDTTKLLLSSTDDAALLKRTVDNLEFLGSTTMTAQAVLQGVNELKEKGRPFAERLFILMSDGNSYNKWIDVLSAADMLNSVGATVAVIAYGDSVYWSEIETYAAGNSSAYNEDNVEHLYGLVMDLTGRTCRNTRSPGECNKPVDIALVIDSSESVEQSFNHYKESALALVNSLTIGDQSTLFTIIQYSREATVQLPFAYGQSGDQVRDALNRVTYIGATTLTSAAVQLGLVEMSNFQRAGSQRIFILMTDGHSFDNWQTVVSTSNMLRDSQATRIILAAGKSLGVQELDEYVKNGGLLITGDDVDALSKEVLKIVGEC